MKGPILEKESRALICDFILINFSNRWARRTFLSFPEILYSRIPVEIFTKMQFLSTTSSASYINLT